LRREQIASVRAILGSSLPPANAFSDLVYLLEILVEMDLAAEHEILPPFHQLWGLRGQTDAPALEQMRTIQADLREQFASYLPE
jgi:hypothetical protein